LLIHAKFFLKGLGHNNIEVYMRDMFIQRCRHFLQRYVYGAQENVDGKPLLVPVEERAVIDASDLSEHQFTINPTWVAYGKKAGQKLLSQAVGSSQQLPHDEGDDDVDEYCIDSREDNENSYTGTSTREEIDGGWGKGAGSHREDWSAGMYDNVRAVPIGQMRKTQSKITRDEDSFLEERRDFHNKFSVQDNDNCEKEDHLTYFERADCAIADVTGPDDDHCMHQFMENQNNNSIYGDSKRDQQQLFKKGRKSLFNRSRGSFSSSSFR